LTVAILTSFRTRESDFKKVLKQNPVRIIHFMIFKPICPKISGSINEDFTRIKHSLNITRNATLKEEFVLVRVNDFFETPKVVNDMVET
jgi:hypothetical protein